jgi:DNA-binding MarR family transcriptional regulator
MDSGSRLIFRDANFFLTPRREPIILHTNEFSSLRRALGAGNPYQRERIMPSYEDCIVFLLGKAYQKAHSAFKKKLARFGVTPVQQLILEVLWEAEKLSPAEISERIAMDGATLTGVLDRMAEAALILKEENPSDRRSVHVSLTARARGLREPLAEERKALNEEFLRVLSLEEQLLLKRMLKDLKE